MVAVLGSYTRSAVMAAYLIAGELPLREPLRHEVVAHLLDYRVRVLLLVYHPPEPCTLAKALHSGHGGFMGCK